MKARPRTEVIAIHDNNIYANKLMVWFINYNHAYYLLRTRETQNV